MTMTRTWRSAVPRSKRLLRHPRLLHGAPLRAEVLPDRRVSAVDIAAKLQLAISVCERGLIDHENRHRLRQIAQGGVSGRDLPIDCFDRLLHQQRGQLARILDRQPAPVVYDYGTGSKTLGFYTRQRYTNVESLESVDIRRQDCFIVTNDSQLGDVMQAFPEARVIAHATGTASNRLAVRLMHANFGRNVELTGLYLIRTGESETR